MKKFLLSFLLGIQIFTTTGQITFERNDSTEFGSTMCCPTSNQILQTHDNGYLSAGYIVSGTITNYFWEKIDSNGHANWWYMFGFIGDTYLNSASITSDNGFILCGNPAASWFPMGIIKTDSNGVNEWQKFIGIPNGDIYGYCAKQTLDRGYIIAGSKYFPGTWDAELIKLDSAGNIMWSKAYGATLSQERFYDIVETDDSGFVAVGSTSQGLDQIFIIRTNSVGDTIWTKRFEDGFNQIEAVSITKTFDNGFVIAGNPKTSGQPVVGSILFKLNFLGDTIWKKNFGMGDSLLINSVKQTNDSGFILVGTFVNRYKGCLIKTNSIGDTLWTRSLNQYCSGMSVCQTYDNGFAIAGGEAACVIKTDEFGNTQCRSISAGVRISLTGLTQIFDNTNVTTDTLTLPVISYGNNGTPLHERMLCNSLGVHGSTKKELQFKVFPNPSEKSLGIDSDLKIKFIEIYNTLGILVQKLNVNHAEEIIIDITTLIPSIYYLRAYTESGILTSKFIKL